MDKYILMPSELIGINQFRLEYLNSLPVFQELYLELMVENAKCYVISTGQSQIGYVLINSDHVLFEFYITESFIPWSAEIFNLVIFSLKVYKVYCKSFDYNLLNCCLSNQYQYKVIGAHYRDMIEIEKQGFTSLRHRLASDEDIAFLLRQEEGLYESEDELVKFVIGQNIYLFFDAEIFIGCGYYIKVHPNWDYIDIGMWVHPQYRRRGFATQIISILKDKSLRNGEKPICGCDINNIASQKTLEKCGFVSNYKLIEFNV